MITVNRTVACHHQDKGASPLNLALTRLSDQRVERVVETVWCDSRQMARSVAPTSAGVGPPGCFRDGWPGQKGHRGLDRLPQPAPVPQPIWTTHGKGLLIPTPSDDGPGGGLKPMFTSWRPLNSPRKQSCLWNACRSHLRGASQHFTSPCGVGFVFVRRFFWARRRRRCRMASIDPSPNACRA